MANIQIQKSVLDPETVRNELDNLFDRLGFRIIIEGYPSDKDPQSYIYTLLDEKGIPCGIVSISNAYHYTIYDEDTPSLHIRDINVPLEYQKRGISRVLLLYGLCDGMIKFPHIEYSDLEDHSDNPVDNDGNLYYSFGYRFKSEEQIPDKMMLLKSFKENEMITLFQTVMQEFTGKPKPKSNRKRTINNQQNRNTKANNQQSRNTKANNQQSRNTKANNQQNRNTKANNQPKKINRRSKRSKRLDNKIDSIA